MSEPTGTPTGGLGVQAMWEQVLKSWENGHVHETFLQHAMAARALAQAATLYREAQEDPNRRDMATRQLEAINTLAMAQLAAAPRTGDPSRRLVIWVIAFAGLGLLFWWLFDRLG